MKKLLALLLALSMLLALAACGGGSDSGSSAPADTGAAEPADTGDAEPADTGDAAEPAAPAADPITLRVAYMPNYASLWAVMTGIKGGYFEEEGITVQLTEFADGPSEIAAMEGGSIDLAYIGKGAHRLCILGQATIFAPSSVHTSDTLIINPGADVTKLEDLKGKKIGYSTGSSEQTMLSALATAGLTIDDVQPYEMTPDNMAGAMMSGSIDVAVTWSPYTFMILDTVEGTTELTFENGSINLSSWICLPSYAEENRDTLIRFSRALYKAMDYGSKEEHMEEVAGWCAEQTKTDLEANLLQWGDAEWFDIATLKAAMADGTMKGYYEHLQQDFVDGGNITADEAVDDVSKFVLFDVMDEALAQVG